MFKNNDIYELSYQDIRIISRFYFEKECEYEYLINHGRNGFGVKDLDVDLSLVKDNLKLWDELYNLKEKGYKIVVSAQWESSFD